MSQRVRLQRKDVGYLSRHVSHTHVFSQRIWHQRMMLLGMIIVVITAVVLRFAVLYPQATAEAASQPVHLTAAPPFGTATPAATARISHKTATALAGATPYSAPIVAGYPDPRLDTPAEQQLRANAGNPQKIILVSIAGQFMGCSALLVLRGWCGLKHEMSLSEREFVVNIITRLKAPPKPDDLNLRYLA